MPLAGRIVQFQIERLATERATAPAGTVDAHRVGIAGRTDYWVSGEDWLVVRMARNSGYRYCEVGSSSTLAMR
jgi:hypothetical protein